MSETTNRYRLLSENYLDFTDLVEVRLIQGGGMIEEQRTEEVGCGGRSLQPHPITTSFFLSDQHYFLTSRDCICMPRPKHHRHMCVHTLILLRTMARIFYSLRIAQHKN